MQRVTPRFHYLSLFAGFTHFVLEGPIGSMNRYLAQNHPIFRLLMPHYLFVIGINRYDNVNHNSSADSNKTL